MDSREMAQRLQRRLNDQGIDIEPLAEEAVSFFGAAGSDVHRRWLDLELQGYGTVVAHAPLHEVLGVAAGHPLVVNVSAYRSQPGRIAAPAHAMGKPFRQFFVERLHDLSVAAQRLRSSPVSEVRLDFGNGAPDHPAAGVFPADVFDRVLLGFRAVLHQELGSAAR